MGREEKLMTPYEQGYQDTLVKLGAQKKKKKSTYHTLTSRMSRRLGTEDWGRNTAKSLGLDPDHKMGRGVARSLGLHISEEDDE